MTSKKTKEEKPKFLRQLLEIVNSSCESGKEVEDWGVYFQDE